MIPNGSGLPAHPGPSCQLGSDLIPLAVGGYWGRRRRNGSARCSLATRMRASTAMTSSGRTITRVEVKLGDLGQVAGEPG